MLLKPFINNVLAYSPTEAMHETSDSIHGLAEEIIEANKKDFKFLNNAKVNIQLSWNNNEDTFSLEFQGLSLDVPEMMDFLNETQTLLKLCFAFFKVELSEIEKKAEFFTSVNSY